MTFDEWLRYGWAKGWCGPPVCEIHDGVPLADDEMEGYVMGEEPCVHIIRLYEDADVASRVVEAHPPTVWRAVNRWGGGNGEAPQPEREYG